MRPPPRRAPWPAAERRAAGKPAVAKTESWPRSRGRASRVPRRPGRRRMRPATIDSRPSPAVARRVSRRSPAGCVRLPPRFPSIRKKLPVTATAGGEPTPPPSRWPIVTATNFEASRSLNTSPMLSWASSKTRSGRLQWWRAAIPDRLFSHPYGGARSSQQRFTVDVMPRASGDCGGSNDLQHDLAPSRRARRAT